jgi:hypothetical protein
MLLTENSTRVDNYLKIIPVDISRFVYLLHDSARTKYILFLCKNNKHAVAVTSFSPNCSISDSVSILAGVFLSLVTFHARSLDLCCASSFILMIWNTLEPVLKNVSI